MLQVAPQCDHQSSGQCHDAYASHALARGREPLVVPLAHRAVGLVPQPAPGELDQQRSDPLVAGLADALLDLAAAAVVGRGCLSLVANERRHAVPLLSFSWA